MQEEERLSDGEYVPCSSEQLEEDITRGQQQKKRRNRTIGVLSDALYIAVCYKLSGEEIDTSVNKNNVSKKIKHFGLHLQDVYNPLHASVRQEVVDKNELIVVSESELQPLLCAYYKELKGSGASKIQNTMNKHFTTVSRSKIQHFLNTLPEKQKMKPQFTNKGPLKTITSTNPMARHQVDLVELTNFPVMKGEVTYLYVLSILDVFSRFLWLVPIPNKSSKAVSDALLNLYFVNGWGCPKILQCDQGNEFKGSVNILCQQMGTRIIRGRPHHPQTQGKSERSHQDWKNHLEFDLMRHKNNGQFDWVESLPVYARIHNESIHSALKCSPYKAMFGVEAVHFGRLIKAGDEVEDYSCSEDEESDSPEEVICTDVNKRIEELVNFRQSVSITDKEASEKTNRRKRKAFDVCQYKSGDNVLVRVNAKGKRVVRGGRKLTEAKCRQGTVIEQKGNTYQVQFNDATKQWINVEDLTSLTRADEKRRKVKQTPDDSGIKVNSKMHSGIPRKDTIKEKKSKPDARKKKGDNDKESASVWKDTIRKKEHKTGRREAKTMSDLERQVAKYGFEIYDNEGAGDCMFIAISEQLLLRNIDDISVRDLRKKIVNEMKNQKHKYNKFLVYTKEHPSYDDYCNTMLKNGEWGDHIVLQATADTYNIVIEVISTGSADPIKIQPTGHRNLRAAPTLKTIHLGHLSELHYVTLLPMETDVSQSNDTMQKAQEEQERGHTEESSDDEQKYSINKSTWDKLKDQVYNHLKKISVMDLPDNMLRRHQEFVKSYPSKKRTILFADGYLSQKFYLQIVQMLQSDLTLQRLKDPKRIYCPRLTLFNFKVEKRLQWLTNKYLWAAHDYVMNVLCEEAIVYLLTQLHPEMDYDTADRKCRETEINMSEARGRCNITIDTE